LSIQNGKFKHAQVENSSADYVAPFFVQAVATKLGDPLPFAKVNSEIKVLFETKRASAWFNKASRSYDFPFDRAD